MAPLVVVLVVLENHSILTAGVKWNHSNLTILVKEEVKNILRTTRLKILMEPLAWMPLSIDPGGITSQHASAF